jgi:cell division septum initiation protein DivIVA
MKPLSEQLSEPSDRVKKAEDFVAVARAKNRAALDSPRALLKFSIGEGKARADAEAAAAQSKVQSWDDTRSSTNSSAATSFDSASPSGTRARRAGSTLVAREKTR